MCLSSSLTIKKSVLYGEYKIWTEITAFDEEAIKPWTDFQYQICLSGNDNFFKSSCELYLRNIVNPSGVKKVDCSQ